MEQAQASETFLSSRQVKDRYGHVSEMWLYRREHEQGGDFQKPVRIRGRRFWRLSDLVAYERALARGTTTTTRNAKLEGDDAQVADGCLSTNESPGLALPGSLRFCVPLTK